MEPEPGDFFDTNVIVYLVSSDAAKVARSAALLAKGGTVSVQVLNEFAYAVRRKRLATWDQIRTVLDGIPLSCNVLPLTLEVHRRAITIAERHQLNLYDANIIASAVLAGCTTLWSEDMHDGLVIDGLTIRNPYAVL